MLRIFHTASMRGTAVAGSQCRITHAMQARAYRGEQEERSRILVPCRSGPIDEMTNLIARLDRTESTLLQLVGSRCLATDADQIRSWCVAKPLTAGSEPCASVEDLFDPVSVKLSSGPPRFFHAGSGRMFRFGVSIGANRGSIRRDLDTRRTRVLSISRSGRGAARRSRQGRCRVSSGCRVPARSGAITADRAAARRPSASRASACRATNSAARRGEELP